MTVTRSAAQSLDWQAHAACQSADADDFFPDGPEDAPATAKQIERAKRVCSGCLVRRPCLEYAVTTKQAHGVWAGTTEDERRDQLAVRRARKQTRRAA